VEINRPFATKVEDITKKNKELLPIKVRDKKRQSTQFCEYIFISSNRAKQVWVSSYKISAPFVLLIHAN
jgi:hypothetical protein